MFVGRQPVRRAEKSLGKLQRVPPLGVQQFSEQAYRGFRFQIGRRTLGLTVKRAIYSVAIHEVDGPDSCYLTDLTSLEAAREAARAWIEEHSRASTALARKPRQSLLSQMHVLK